jgi:ATP-dependent Clp endopeptidase proteolytic subunit ClpP
MLTIPLSGIVGEDFDGPFVRSMLTKAGGTPVRAEIASPGGLVVHGFEIFNLFKNYPGETTAHLMGEAMSMGSYIAMACQRVTAEANAIFMIHEATAGVLGRADDMRGMASAIDKINDAMAEAYAGKSGLPLSEIQDMMKATTFLSAQEAMSAGFVDEVVGTPWIPKEQAVARALSHFTACQSRIASAKAPDRMELVAFLGPLPEKPRLTAEQSAALDRVREMGYSTDAPPEELAEAIGWIVLGITAEEAAQYKRMGLTLEDMKDPRLQRPTGARWW